MRKRWKCGLLLVMMMFGLVFGAAGASATEAAGGTDSAASGTNGAAGTSGTTAGTSESAGASGTTAGASDSAGTQAAAVRKKGWNKEGKYYFYCTASGKAYTGWKTIGKYTYYFRKTADGAAPVGSRMTGLQKIGKYTYYFNKKGVLLTGWRTVSGNAHYFRKSGKLGVKGRMYTGLQKVGKSYYYFGTDGKAATGWTKIKGKLYYFSKSKTLGTRGSAYTGWKKIGKYKYYFSSKGLRYTSRWINKKYYVDENGRMLKSCVTPDGYVVGSDGARQKKASGWIKSGGKYYYYTSGKKAVGWKKISGKYYYFDTEGIRQKGWLTVNGSKYYLKNYRLTGWQTIGGKKYYFKSNGKMAVNTTVDGIAIGADGVAAEETATKDGTSILLIAGHGQGDVGAIGKYSKNTYYEYKLTREFATLIYNHLQSAGSKFSVTMYNQDYDCYQQNAKTLGSAGAKITFTGSGAKKAKVLAAIRASSTVPDFTKYDYVLEIHFNATAESNKDSKGDGNQKGIGMYINAYKAKKTSNYTIDRNIVAAVAKQTGFKVWGGGAGIFSSDGLFNAKTCQELGVSYGLLETAFIDDKDDITFYNKNKDAMAQAVASAIVSYFN